MSIQKFGKHTCVDVDYCGANLGCIITGQGMVLIDTPFLPDEIKKWGREVARLSNKGVRYVINTHHHFDHVLGNGAYCPNIIADETCYRQMLKPDGTALRYFVDRREDIPQDVRKQIYQIPIVLPNITFSNRLHLHLGDVNLEMWHVGGHSDTSIYTYVVEDKVLFTGDVFQTNMHPYMGQGNFREWIRALEATVKLDFDTIVPGHGIVGDRDEVKRMLTFFRQLWNRAKKAQQAGMSRAETVKQIHDHINFYPLNPGEEKIQIYEFDNAVGRLYDEIAASK